LPARTETPARSQSSIAPDDASGKAKTESAEISAIELTRRNMKTLRMADTPSSRYMMKKVASRMGSYNKPRMKAL